MEVTGAKKFFAKYLGILNFSQQLQSLIQRYYSLSGLTHASIMISSTFYTLFILDEIGFAKLGVLLSIGFIFQALIDFPSAMIADWLGHKWVLASSYFLHAVSFILLAFTNFIGEISQSFVFPYLVLVFVLESLALAIESGALQAFFDNNYKLMIGKKDDEMKIYGGIFGKTLVLIRALGGISIAAGGYIAYQTSRETVFVLQGILLGCLSILFIFTVTDVREVNRFRPNFKRFSKNLFNGFVLIFRSRSMIFFQIAYIITIITNLIWINIIVYPIYFGYSGSDSIAATLRTGIFIFGGLMTTIGVEISKKFKLDIWLPITATIFAIVFYGGFVTVLLIYPLENAINLTALYLLFGISVIGMLINTVWLLLLQRYMLDIIPDEHRNAFYSLSPTLALIIGSIAAYIVGKFIAEFENNSVILDLLPGLDNIFALSIIVFLIFPTVIAGITLFISIQLITTDEYKERLIDPHFHIAALDNIMFGPENSIDLTKMSNDLKIQSIAQNLVNNLLSTATEDGVISRDEQNLLEQIIGNIQEYIHVLENAMEDDLIDEEEKEMLFLQRKKILDDAYRTASIDEEITEEEYALLNKLTNIISKFEEIEKSKK